MRALNAIKGGLYKTSQSLKVRKIQFKFDLSPSKTKTLFTSFASTLISYCTQFFFACFVLFFYYCYYYYYYYFIFLPLGVLGNFAYVGTRGEFGWLKAIYGPSAGRTQEKIANNYTFYISRLTFVINMIPERPLRKLDSVF